MGQTRQFRARTLEVAVSKAARELGVSRESIVYEVVFDGRKGLFGFGQRDVVIEVDPGRQRAAPPPAEGQPDGGGPEPGNERYPRERIQAPRRPPERPESSPGRRMGPSGQSRGRGGQVGQGTPGQRPPRQARGPRERGRCRPEGGSRPQYSPERPAPAPIPETPEAKALFDLGQALVAAMKLELDSTVRMEEGQLFLEFRGEDERLAIGHHGEVLDALQHVVNKMLPKHPVLAEHKVIVDSAGYRRRHDQEIQQRARQTASKVRDTGEAVQLEAMNPYQRRVVHLALRDEPGVRTFSTGEGFLRRLTIAPSD